MPAARPLPLGRRPKTEFMGEKPGDEPLDKRICRHRLQFPGCLDISCPVCLVTKPAPPTPAAARREATPTPAAAAGGCREATSAPAPAPPSAPSAPVDVNPPVLDKAEKQPKEKAEKLLPGGV